MSSHTQGSPRQKHYGQSNYVQTTPQLRRFGDYNTHSLSPPLARRSHPAYGLPPSSSLKPPLPSSDAESVQLPQILYLQKSPLENHKCRVLSKFRFACLGLATLCLASAAMAFFGHQFAFRHDYEFALHERPEDLFGYQVYLWRGLKQALLIASWSCFLCSLGTFFVAGTQLVLALKIIKSQPESPQVALTFLAEARFIRTAAVFLWSLSAVAFIFLLPQTIPHPILDAVPTAVGVGVGVVMAVICLFTIVQGLYSMCKIDYVVPTHFSMDERYDLDAVGGQYARGGGLNFSTLV